MFYLTADTWYNNYTFKTAFQYQDEQVYWCTADVSWITGHSYILWSMSAGTTTIMFEDTVVARHGRFWQAIERHR
jgi:acetyl-CoA synthetase